MVIGKKNALWQANKNRSKTAVIKEITFMIDNRKPNDEIKCKNKYTTSMIQPLFLKKLLLSRREFLFHLCTRVSLPLILLQ